MQTDAVLHAGVLHRLGKLLSHSRPNLVKEAAWTISNITAGNPEQIQQVIQCNLMGPLIRVLREVFLILMYTLSVDYFQTVSYI